MTPLLALLLAANASGSTNVISRVGVADVGADLEVTISGSRVPSFTTFATSEPARFVIDLPDAVLATRGPAVTPEGTILREVVAEQRVAEGVQQTRVTLALTAAVEPPRVRTRGNDLVIRVARARNAPAAKPVEIAEVVAVAPPTAPEPPKPESMPESKPMPVAELERVVEPAPVAAAAPVVERAPAARPIESAAVVPPRESAAGRTRPPTSVPAAESTSVHRRDAAARPAVAIAVAEPPRADDHAPRADDRAPRAVYAGIGFSHSAGVSRVLVRTIGAPRFTVSEAGSSLVIVLERARAARANDLLPLDTSFFPSVVRAVVPGRDAAGTRIEIQLRRMVPFRQEVEGDVLAIVFEAPEDAAGARR